MYKYKNQLKKKQKEQRKQLNVTNKLTSGGDRVDRTQIKEFIIIICDSSFFVEIYILESENRIYTFLVSLLRKSKIKIKNFKIDFHGLWTPNAAQTLFHYPRSIVIIEFPEGRSSAFIDVILSQKIGIFEFRQFLMMNFQSTSIEVLLNFRKWFLAFSREESEEGKRETSNNDWIKTIFIF